MAAKRKKVPVIAGVVITLIVIAAIAGVLLFDINSYKPRIEAAASEATGLDVRINGEMGLIFFPFGLSAENIHVAGKGVEILSLKKIKIGMELISLLKNQLKFTSCELDKPTITIVKDAEGKYNFKKKSMQERPGTAFHLNKFRLSQGALVYFDQKADEKTELKGINLSLQDFRIRDTAEDIIKNVSFTGNIECKAMRKNVFKIDNIKTPVKAEKGIIYLISLTMDIFGAKGEGEAAINMSKVDIVYKIDLKISNLDFAKLEESFGMEKVIDGKGELNASLTIKENGTLHLINGMDGTFSLRGDNLVIHTVDLDEVLSSYETSQQFNLVDLGAYFIAGPLSTVGLKGYRYWDVYDQTQEGAGFITQFISNWKIQNGIASAIDCALATQHNRVALIGNLNLISERYNDVTVALLDDKGCAKFKQSISGSLGSPEISAVSMFQSLGEPIFNLYRQTKRFVQSDSCEVFYKGSVRQP
ncbi:MAG: AsmA family protein [Desulfobacterales bacterium]